MCGAFFLLYFFVLTQKSDALKEKHCPRGHIVLNWSRTKGTRDRSNGMEGEKTWMKYA